MQDNIISDLRNFIFEEKSGIKMYKKFLKKIEKIDMPYYIVRDIKRIIRDEEEHLDSLQGILDNIM